MPKIRIIPESIQLLKMTDAEYFSAKYKDYISNSKLGLINPLEGGSIEKYESGFKSDYSESFELGSAVHAIVLQPDEYEIASVRKPTGKLGLFANKVYELEKASKEITREKAIELASIDANYYAGKLTTKRLETALIACEPYWEERKLYEQTLAEELHEKQIYLSDSMFEKYSQCILGIKNNSSIQETLYPQGLISQAEVYNEYAILCEVELTYKGESSILKLKAKLDNFTIDHETQTLTLNDLKTSGKPVNYFMGNKVKTFTEETGEQWVWYDGSFEKYHYYRQMGLYLFLLQAAVKHLYNLNYKLRANMVVVETIPNFSSKVYTVSNKYIKLGLDEFKNLLILVAEWTKTKQQM